MFCSKCGKQIPDGASLCEECAAAQQPAETPVAEAPAEVAPVAAAPVAPKKKIAIDPKLIKIVAPIVGAVVVVAVVLIVLFSTVFNRLKLTDYIKITGVEGYDGHASVVYEIDFKGLAEELKFERTKDIKKLQNLIEDGEVDIPTTKDEVEAIEEEYDLKLKEVRKLIGAFEIEIEGDGEFSNGDEVKLVIEADDDADLKKKLIGGELTYKVEGLEELEQLDLFSAYEVTFSGMSGKGYIDVSRESYNGWKSALSYTIDKESELSNGDTVKVTITVNNYEYYFNKMLAEGCYLPETAEKTFTVSGLQSYLSKDKIDATITEEAIKIAKTYFGAPDEWTLGKVYFLKSKDGVSGSYVDNYIVVTFSKPGSYWTSTRTIGLTDNKVDDKGTVQLAESSYCLFSGTDKTEAQLLKQLQDYYGERYTIETLK
jgi:hypothetical protein